MITILLLRRSQPSVAESKGRHRAGMWIIDVDVIERGTAVSLGPYLKAF